MPVYEYECTVCKKHHDIMQKITEDPLTECPDCGGTLKKMISNTSFVLKGTGWYVTDYASNGRKKEKDTGIEVEKGTEKEAGTKKEPKTETKADTKEAVTSKQ